MSICWQYCFIFRWILVRECHRYRHFSFHMKRIEAVDRPSNQSHHWSRAILALTFFDAPIGLQTSYPARLLRVLPNRILFMFDINTILIWSMLHGPWNMTVHFRPLKPSILTLLERSSRISHANSNIKLMPDKPKMPWTKLIKNKNFIFYIFWKMSQYMVAKTWSSSAF